MYDRLNQSKIKRVAGAPLTTLAIGLILLFTGIPIYLMVKHDVGLLPVMSGEKVEGVTRITDVIIEVI